MIKKIMASLIRFYQLTFSSLVGHCCRFQPTCSEYAKEAYQKYGIIKGTYLTVWRLLRCHPWAKGGYDPVP
ncbi:MAG: membrane protein insertion efficiency factor YidD [Alphaproteobacteria bacterium]|nr:membrane protein insertion efficiency factor YidD [Alphaproteobacteria bacterium]